MSLFNMRIGGAGGASASIFAYGDQLQNTDTVYAQKDGKRINGVWQTKQIISPDWHGLPAEYQEVEYLEGTGKQSIQAVSDTITEIIIKAEIDCKVQPNSYSGYSSYAGSWYATNANNEYMLASTALIPGSDASDRQVITHISGLHSLFPDYTGVNPNSAKGILTVGDTTVTKIGTSNWKDSSDLNHNYYLFLSYVGDTYAFIGKIYGAKIYNYLTNKIIRNFIPCYRKSDHKPGMYDMINDVFYANQGTGADFLVGADVVPQYITVVGFEIAPIREYGTWEVTAGNGMTTKTVDVLIDAAEEFNIEVLYAA